MRRTSTSRSARSSSYKYERKQFRDLKETAAGKDKPLVELYGARAPARLFVKLPELLAQCKMQREHMQVLVSKLMGLLQVHPGEQGQVLRHAVRERDRTSTSRGGATSSPSLQVFGVCAEFMRKVLVYASVSEIGRRRVPWA